MADNLSRYLREMVLKGDHIAANISPLNAALIANGDGTWFEGKWYPRVKCERRGRCAPPAG